MEREFSDPDGVDGLPCNSEMNRSIFSVCSAPYFSSKFHYIPYYFVAWRIIAHQ